MLTRQGEDVKRVMGMDALISPAYPAVIAQYGESCHEDRVTCQLCVQNSYVQIIME